MVVVRQIAVDLDDHFLVNAFVVDVDHLNMASLHRLLPITQTISLVRVCLKT